MADFLQTYLQIIPASQKEKLLDVIKSSETKVTDYNPAIVDSLLSENYEKMTSYVKQPEYLSSEDYNKTIASIYGDLSLLYKYADITDVFLLNNKILDMSDFSVIENELAKLKSQIASLSAKMQSTKTTQVFIDTFVTTGNSESRTLQTEHLFTDRDGSNIEHVVEINTGQNSCTLPVSWSVNAFKDKNGTSIAKINYINKPAKKEDQVSHIYKGITNKALIEDASSKLENCIDESIKTYWKETIQSDEKLKSKVNGRNEYGFFVEFEITLDTPKLINGFSMFPFSDMPMDIVSIKVLKDINEDTIPVVLQEIETEFIVANQNIKIAPVVAKRIIITLRQQNYTVITYSAKKSKLSSRKSWTELKRNQPEEAMKTFEDYSEKKLIRPRG
jgi:hypothetical protein